MGSLFAEVAALYRAERRLKHGEIDPDEFLELKDSLARSEDAFQFFRATVLVVLHVPLIEIPYLLGLFFLVPVLAAFLVTGPGGLQTVFLIYVTVRSLVGVQDTAMMAYAHREGHIPFNSSFTGTVLGTLPYPYSYVLGPAIWTAVEIGLYFTVFALPGLFSGAEAVVPGLLPAISTIGILQVLWHTLVRGGANLVISWEIPRISDPDTFHRVRAVLWRTKNRLLGRSADEIRSAEQLWYQMRDDLRSDAWDGLEARLEGMDRDSRKRVTRYLLASRKDEMILRELLAGAPAPVT